MLALALLTITGCGKKSPPLPPVERVRQRVEIASFQRGDTINLSWTMPARNAERGSLLNISRADVYRLAEPLAAPLTLTEEEFAARATLIHSLPVTEQDFALKQINYQDKLDFAGQPVRLRYAIRFVNASGQKAAFSNFLLIEPTAKVAAPPTQIKATETEQAVLLSWETPGANIDGSRPANVLGYNVYRKPAEEAAANFRLLTRQPVTERQFADGFFEFGTAYSYLLRTVSLGSDGRPIESADSDQVTVTPRDTYPPTAPTAITTAAAPGSISLFFASNPEKDVAGYRIYRALDAARPKNEWELLTKELLSSNTFQDTRVESGQTYFYYIRAIDKAGNVSAPSEVVSETVP